MGFNLLLLFLCSFINLSQTNIIKGCGDGDTCTCNPNQDCKIKCDQSQKCKGATLRGGSATSVEIYCTGEQGCQDANIYCGATASTCAIDCTGDTQGCSPLKRLDCGESVCWIECGNGDQCESGVSNPIDVSDAISFACLGNCNSDFTDKEFTQEPTTDPTKEPTKTPTDEPTEGPTEDPTVDPTTDPTTDPTEYPTNVPTLYPSVSPTQPPTIAPSISPSNIPSISPTQPPTISPTTVPSNIPSITPTQPPSNSPSNVPSLNPSYSPTQPPSTTPSKIPTQPPSISPSIAPSETPTQPPSLNPSYSPSQPPTLVPSISPSIVPSFSPSQPPTLVPSISPSTVPSSSPSQPPSISPSNAPSLTPSLAPTITPTTPPTLQPGIHPTWSPTLNPSIVPSNIPTIAPSNAPTSIPSNSPTISPSVAPSISPTAIPSLNPSIVPSIAPTLNPSIVPTLAPSLTPSLNPSLTPTINPTLVPSIAPSLIPTISPSIVPSIAPTIVPSLYPTIAPSAIPSQPPTIVPSLAPTVAPSLTPTINPSLAPSLTPTQPPSISPTSAPTVIGIDTQFELFVYYNTSAALGKTVLPIFNIQFANAMLNGIKYVIYNNDSLQNKFIDTSYTCISFTIWSFDSSDENYEDERYQCDIYKKELKKSDSEINPRYKPKTKAAQYLGLVRVVLTGNDLNSTISRADNLTLSLNNSITKDAFIRYAENCIKHNVSGDLCPAFEGIKTFEIISLDAGLYIPPGVKSHSKTVAEHVVDALVYTIYIFITLCLIASICGKMYAKKHKSDNVKAFGILFFSLYTWDFYSDIMFCIRLGDANEWSLFAVSVVFIVVPWIMNLIQLFQAQHKWTTDKKIQAGVRGWFVDWSIILVVAVCISGNSFGAIELANSNLFGHDLFSMGLNERHLKEFQSKRFYSSVLLENVPQLITQIYFLTILGAFDEATFIALLSSSISIILSIVDIWSAKKLVSVMDNTQKSNININHIEFNIMTNDEINLKKKILLTRPKALSKAIGETLEIDSRTVEIYLLLAANDGIKIGFNVYAVDYGLHKMIDDLIDNQKKLQLLITNYWHLKTFPVLSEFRKGEHNNDDNNQNTKDTASTDAFNPLHLDAQRVQAMSVASVGSTHIPISSLNTIEMTNLKNMDPELNIRKNTNDLYLKTPLISDTIKEEDDDNKIYIKYLNNLKLYMQSQLKIYKKNSFLSNNKPINISYINNNNNKKNINLWKGYTNNIKKLIEERNKLTLKVSNNDDDNNNVFNLQNEWNKCIEYYLSTKEEEEEGDMDDTNLSNTANKQNDIDNNNDKVDWSKSYSIKFEESENDDNTEIIFKNSNDGK